jgi:hydroxymethylbilane synthase
MQTLKARTIKLGTRTSKLARWQTDYILSLLNKTHPDLHYQVVEFVTQGDKVLDRPLPEIGGKGVFTEELEKGLRSGMIDLAIHSLKDLPIEDIPGLSIAAVSKRFDARDVLISAKGWTLATLPDGARVGTSSLRRAAQLLAFRPDLSILSLRGNVDTRIRKAMQEDYDAVILAAAGVLRLGLEHSVTEFLPIDVMLPAPGQGAIAVQARSIDLELKELLMRIDHPMTNIAVTAERAFLAALGGGCSVPVGAYAECDDTSIELNGIVASIDGQKVIRVSGKDSDPRVLGRRLADQALAQGAGELLL